MEWLNNLFTNTESVAHIALLFALVISIGVLLGKIKIAGISLGVTFVLFTGIIAGHIGFTAPLPILTFVQDFGLILFVFCIGLQVGPGFFESFRKGGVTLNMLSTITILLNILVMFGCYYLFFDTSNPHNLPIIAVRYICKINLEKEDKQLAEAEAENPHAKPHQMYLKVRNSFIVGRTLKQISEFLNREMVCTRMLQNGTIIIPNQETIFNLEDEVLIVCAEGDYEAIQAFIGPEIEAQWKEEPQAQPLISRRLIVTNPAINGKTLGRLNLSSIYGVNVTRITRQGIDLFATRDHRFQIGDRIMVVGPEDNVNRVSSLVGNSTRHLDAPNIATIFIGIVVGIIFGSIPISLPNMPVPLKLGIAGGPLIISILIGRFGYKFKLVSYTTTSANMMLREIGLVLFLACVGIKAGAHFWDTVVQGDGLKYVYTGFIITIIPILIIGTIARMKYKFNYFTIMGMLAGTYTDPPALAYANQISSREAASIGYSTVYPLTMFLRIFTAQLIVLFFCG